MSEELINAMNKIKYVVNSKGKNRIKDEHIKEIASLYEDIELLDKHQITDDNFKAKSGEYLRFRTKAYEQYGIKLDENMPFKNPTALRVKIYNILKDKAKLNTKQIEAFYIKIEIPKPDKGTICKYNTQVDSESTILKIIQNLKEEHGNNYQAILDDAVNQPNKNIKYTDEEQQILQEQQYYEDAITQNKYKFSRILKYKITFNRT